MVRTIIWFDPTVFFSGRYFEHSLVEATGFSVVVVVVVVVDFIVVVSTSPPSNTIAVVFSTVSVSSNTGAS